MSKKNGIPPSWKGHSLSSLKLFSEDEDLSRFPAGRFFFDHDSAKIVLEFFETCIHHVDGEWAEQPFKPQEWQRRIIRDLFGWKRKDTGYRKHTNVYIEVPKKNGKSTMAAGIALALIFIDEEPGAKVYSVAADRKQAAIVFDTAARMVRMEPILLNLCDVFKRSIFVPRTASLYEVLSADVKTKHGFNAHGIIFDELHAQDNRALWDTVKGAGAARRQPVRFAMTTAGYDETSICFEEHVYAKNVIEGNSKDDSLLAVIYAADEKDDWTARKTWEKANPNLGVCPKLEFMESEVEAAKRKPASISAFKRLHLNIWTRQRTEWMPMEEWRNCAQPVSEELLRGKECFGGIDLSSTEDLTSYALVFPRDIEESDGKLRHHYDVLLRCFLPDANMPKRVKNDRVPYDLWAKQGFLTLTPGNMIDYAFIEAAIFKDAEKFRIRELAYDRWNASQLITDLQNEGLTVFPHGQGFASFAGPTKELLESVLSVTLHHGGHPVLTWAASNVTVKQDPAGNVKPDKAASRERIDPMVALIMAFGRATANAKKISVYNERGLLTV